MKIYVFNERISLFSSTRLAGEGRIKEILGVSQLPKVLHPLLRQPVISQKEINPFLKLRTRARKFLRKNAARDPFFGWVINPARKDEIISGMNIIRDEFYVQKQRLIENLQDILDAILDEVRESCAKEGFANCDALVEAIRDAQPSEAYLKGQIAFEFLEPRLIDLDPSEEQKVREGVYSSALHEIAVRAEESANVKSAKSKIQTLNEILGKIDGLAYVETRLGRIAEGLRECLAQIPRGIPDKEYRTVDILALDGIISRIVDETALADAVSSGRTLFPVTMATENEKEGTLFDVPDETAPSEESDKDAGEEAPEPVVESAYNW